MMTPPATWLSQPCLLTSRPQSCTATILVQRTTPVSVSTSTSATCTPPTCTFEMPRLAGWFASPACHRPVALASSIPRRAHASFHVQLLFLPLSWTLPPSRLRSAALEPSLPAIFSNRASRTDAAACSAAGACDGQVVLPPEPDELPRGDSPIL